MTSSCSLHDGSPAGCAFVFVKSCQLVFGIAKAAAVDYRLNRKRYRYDQQRMNFPVLVVAFTMARR